MAAHPSIADRRRRRTRLRGIRVAAAWCILPAGLMTGCDGPPPGSTQGGAAATIGDDDPALVAPVFEHGAGRGTVGRPNADADPMPVFLTEDEGLEIIIDELSRHGLELTRQNVILEEVLIAQRTERVQRSGEVWETTIIEGDAFPLQVDLCDETRRIAIEFVSASDHDELGGVRSLSAVQEYDLKDVALRLGEQVGAAGRGICFAALYDPVTPREVRLDGADSDRHEALRAARRAAAAESQRLLRAQVADLAGWMRQHGVIGP